MNLNVMNLELKKEHIFLLMILFTAFVVRTFNLDIVPKGLYLDEASIGYNAFCISEILKDEHGNFLPLYFEAFGEYKNPVIIYLAALLIKFFGPHVVVLRMSSVILGLIAVFFTYKLTALYFDKKVALFAAFLLALSPWHIIFSRYVVEPIAYPAFFLMGFYFFKKGLLENKKYFIISSIPIALSVYAYGIGRLFSPVFFFILFLLNIKKIWEIKKQFLIFISLMILFLSPLLYWVYTKPVQGRFQLLSIANEQFSVTPIKNEYESKGLKVISDHKFALLPIIFIKNYFKHMSLDFLLLNGDRNLRHHLHGRGELLLFTSIFCLIGFIALLCGRKDLWIFPIWFLLFPVPTSLTWESLPHAARSICGLPVFQIMASVGFFICLDLLKSFSESGIWKKIQIGKILTGFFLFISIGLLALDSGRFLISYFDKYPKMSSRWFSYDQFSLAVATEQYKDRYDSIILPIRYTPVVFLFLQKVNPDLWVNGEDKLPYTFLRSKIMIGTNMGDLRVAKPNAHVNERIIGHVKDPVTNRLQYNITVVEKRSKKMLEGKHTGGLIGMYYQGENFDKLRMNRIDTFFSRNWGFDSPTSKIKPDHFSIKWQGFLFAKKPGNHTFVITGDDGMRLFINGKAIVDDWTPHSPVTHRAKAVLNRGWNQIEIHYYDHEGLGSISLQYKDPNGKTMSLTPDILSPS